MYPNYSLYPGGAFMMCESVSEFDDAVRPPESAVDKQQKDEMIREINDKDPVLRVISKLGPVYEDLIHPLLNMPYGEEGDNVSDVVNKFEKIADAASNAVNALRCIVVKQKGMLDLYNDPANSPIMDSFNNHVGLFMKKTEAIRHQGIEHSRFNYNAMPAFVSMWDVRNFVQLFVNRPELLDDIVLANTLRPFYGEEYGRQSGIVRSFDGLIDLVDCIYRDSERMSRLEAVESQSIDFNDLMSSQRYNNAEERPYRGDHDEILRSFLRLASTTLRNISMSCFDSICSITDGEGVVDTNVINAMKVAMMRTVNIFAIGTVVAMTMATMLRKNVAHESAIKDYTALLLNTLKTV